jgi:RimJ/RimL family protein N-acetyltransferase
MAPERQEDRTGDEARPPDHVHAELTGPRLALEPLRLEHERELAPLLADPALHVFTGGEPDTPAERRARIARQVRGRSPDGRDVWMNWVLRDGTDAVGTLQATLRPDRVAEVAWVVFTPFQGRRYAREAAVVLVEWLLVSGTADAVVAHIHADHAASAAVARAAGLAPTAERHHGEVVWRRSG